MLREENYWYVVRRPQYYGFARQPIMQKKRDIASNDRKPHVHYRGCGCQVLLNGRPIERGTNRMRLAN